MSDIPRRFFCDAGLNYSMYSYGRRSGVVVGANTMRCWSEIEQGAAAVACAAASRDQLAE
jgi:hypothetical protein